MKPDTKTACDGCDGFFPTSRNTYDLPPVLSVREAAAFLGLNLKTVYASVDAKQLPGRRVGKRVVILRDALLQWLRSNERVLPPARGK